MSKKILAIIALFILTGVILGGIYLYTKTRQNQADAPQATSESVETTVLAQSPTPVASESASPLSAMNATNPATAPNPILDIIVTDTGTPTAVTAADSKKTLPAATDVIKVIVHLDAKTTATTAVLKMTYIADDSVLGPASAPIKTVNGKKMAAFGMKKPPAGWPNGPYSLFVALPTGESKELTFIVQ